MEREGYDQAKPDCTSQEFHDAEAFSTHPLRLVMFTEGDRDGAKGLLERHGADGIARR
ncbi:hypothetical protein N6H05_00205 [Sphingobium sp. WTD-1]|uniref:hypothetical protein n=1 Tax=Sphingobium sp. WTD-1 TaxID=2979467 RepID=UPI0024DE5533|nr:hypothetical protein [Sphingobium sp. WTD-1]WIA58814.1 hypothetical protein N6H05_00205 [Sphingobium sp. WTD-1]